MSNKPLHRKVKSSENLDCFDDRYVRALLYECFERVQLKLTHHQSNHSSIPRKEKMVSGGE